MKLDIVDTSSASYININPKNNKPPIISLGNGVSGVYQICKTHKDHFSDLEYFTKVVEKFPDFCLTNVVTHDENEKKIIFKNKKLRELLSANQVKELFEAYRESNAIFEQYQKDALSYRSGERETHPHSDKPSWVDKQEAIFSGKRHLDNLVNDIQNQMIRQHSINSFQYDKENGLPCRVYFNGTILRVAQEDGSNNHGHSDYLFEEFEVSDIEKISPNGLESIFPIRRVSLNLLGSKYGHSDYSFVEEFYKA